MGDLIDIKDNQICLITIPKDKYNAYVSDIVKFTSELVNKICYVGFNQPYNALKLNNSKNNLDESKFFFIDTLTKSVQNVEDTEDCIFVSAPNALTEISVAFSKSINEKKCDSAIFDSLSALLVYQNAHSIIQFTHNLITKLRIAGSKAVFIALKEDVDNELIKDLYMFVDKVIEK